MTNLQIPLLHCTLQYKEFEWTGGPYRIIWSTIIADQFRKQVPLVRNPQGVWGGSTFNYIKRTVTLKSMLIVPVKEWEIMLKIIWKRLITQGWHQNYSGSLEAEELSLMKRPWHMCIPWEIIQYFNLLSS